jgi:uncharacterized LabA/DUF88 family protein
MATVWIVDGAYMMKGAPGRFDYVKLKNELEKLNGEPFLESFYLNSTPNPATDAQDSFHTWMKMAPPKGPKMRVQLYKLKDMRCECPNCGNQFERTVQKGVDVAIATLLIKLAVHNRYDRVILSAGDGDFESAVDYVKDVCGKQFWIAGFNGSISADLQSYADKMILVDSFWSAIQKQVEPQ